MVQHFVLRPVLMIFSQWGAIPCEVADLWTFNMHLRKCLILKFHLQILMHVYVLNHPMVRLVWDEGQTIMILLSKTWKANIIYVCFRNHVIRENFQINHTQTFLVLLKIENNDI